MATVYVGPRPVLKGRTLATAVRTVNNELMVYSNFLLMQPDHVLDGAPDRQFVVGIDNRYRKAKRLAQQFAGTMTYISEMANAGNGIRQTNGRYRPLEFKGLSGSAVFTSGYGHTFLGRTFTYSLYSNDIYDGVPSGIVFTSTFGHARRFNATWGGAFDPYGNKGVTPQALAGGGQAVPATATTSQYGHNRVNEWRGVPSSKAL